MHQLPLLAALCSATAPAVLAAGNATVEPVQTVLVKASSQQDGDGEDAASTGTVPGEQLRLRPLARTADLLEAVPGMSVTQHSGDGKANQYFVRGFNLDHGTDFRTTVLGMPVNMPTHAHGQGYADLNFIIPELVDSIAFRKGTYHADAGDFSSAGTAAFDYLRTLPAPLASLQLGAHGYRRGLLAGSQRLGAGHALAAIESTRNDGPWELPQDFRRHNAVLSYSRLDDTDALRIAAMAHRARWSATDSGQLGRYGVVDPSDGGGTSRVSLSADWQRQAASGTSHAGAYLIRSTLDLYGNFTYFLGDPVNGDQFNQFEQRRVGGAEAEHSWRHPLGRFDSSTSVGAQLRHDRIGPVGLHATVARRRLATVRQDRVRETALSAYAANSTRWTDWLRTTAGLRADRYRFDVESGLAANSGTVDAHLFSPKWSAVISPAAHTRLYVNWGRGFHSNDARGVVQRVDPLTGAAAYPDGQPVARATPLVTTTGWESGARLNGLLPRLEVTLSLWQLELDSELVFVGDAGSTEASRPSRRRGVELTADYRFAPGWRVHLDLAVSRARFIDTDPAGARIPGALARSASLAVTRESGKWTGALELRHVGARPLIEDGSVRSPASTLADARLAYTLTPRVTLSVDALNLFDRVGADIAYYYASRLRHEAAGVEDVHWHPVEPRTLRWGLAVRF